MAVCRQILSTGIVCYLCLIMGIMFTWPSSTLKLFQSTNTTLSRPMNPTELALFGSLSSIGALVSTPLAGVGLDKFGRKYSAILSSLTNVLSWTIVASCKQVELVLASTFISGLAGGVFLIVPVYVGEICQESIRGAMTSGSMIFYTMGMLASYLLGGCLQYSVMIYVCLSMSVISVALLSFLKESPVYLMQKGFEEEAAKSIAFYRSTKTSSKETLNEMNAIRRALNPDMEELSPEEQQKLKPEEVQAPQERLSILQFLRKSSSTKRALIVCLILITASIFQGLVVVQVYAEPLFEEAVPTMSPTVCSVLLAVVSVLSGVAAAYFSDVSGRKSLLIYGSLASGVSCIFLGSQIHLHWAPHYFTAVCMYTFCAVYTLGAGTMPYVITAEVFLPEIKSFVSMLVIEWAWMCNFIILFIFNPLVELLGLGPVFYLFGVICFGTSIFCVFWLPETKGMPVDAIQTLFTRKKKNIPQF